MRKKIASVIIPCWKEPDRNVRASLVSLRKQNIIRRYPKRFELVFVGCKGINMDIPAKYADRLLCAEGKLRARHEATKASKGKIIVSADCDTFYPPDSLGRLLKPFEDPEVVATTGTNSLPFPLVLFKPLALLHWSSKMLGRFSAYRKWAYWRAGGFDLSYDRTDPHTMMREEEFGFFRRLSWCGEIRLVDTNVVHLGASREGRGLRASSR